MRGKRRAVRMPAAILIGTRPRSPLAPSLAGRSTICAGSASRSSPLEPASALDSVRLPAGAALISCLKRRQGQGTPVHSSAAADSSCTCETRHTERPLNRLKETTRRVDTEHNTNAKRDPLSESAWVRLCRWCSSARSGSSSMIDCDVLWRRSRARRGTRVLRCARWHRYS